MRHYCLFSAQYPPHVGGVERYTEQLALELANAGNQVTVVTANVNALPELERFGRISIFRLPCFSLLNGRLPIPKKNKSWKNLVKLLSKEHFDFAIVNTRFYPHSLFGVQFAAKREIPCIVIEHGSAHLSLANPLIDQIINLYEHWITYRIQHYCKNFYGVSPASNEWLRHFSINAKGILYNAIDLVKIKVLSEHPVRNFSAEYGISQNTLCVCFVGRLIKEKGVYALLEAVRRLYEEGIAICLFLAGDGPLEKTVQNFNCPAVIPVGALPFEEVVALYTIADVFCLPSVSEGFCASFLEAVACRTFPISTAVGIVPQVITSEACGILLPDSSEASVYAALKQVNQLSEEKREEIAENAYNQMMRCGFSMAATARKIIHLCEGSYENTHPHSGLQ